jgi:hypothetical protein
MAVAVFDYNLWTLRYPALAAKVPEPLAVSYFAEAGLFLDNTDCSIVTDVAARLILLNMIVAHIAYGNGASAASEAGLVGRISSVTEGSVTIATEFKGFSGDLAAYFSQSPYGVEYWAMTAGYRTAHYVPGVQPFLGVPGYLGGQRWPL